MKLAKPPNSLNAKTKILTSRQTKIIAHMAVGATDEEIAGKLGISPHTIETEIDKIFVKTKVSNRLEATLWAAKNL